MSRTLVCAIQIGSSRINAAAAWRDAMGSYEIAAIEQEPTNGCVRRGCIVDVERASTIIRTLVQRLNNRVMRTNDCRGIDAAYVGINGISMHSEANNPVAKLEDGKPVDNETIAALRHKSRLSYIPGYVVLDVDTIGYKLNDVDCRNPEGLTGDRLVARHQLVIAQQRLRNNVSTAMKTAGVRLIVDGILATPRCVGQILTPDEKQRGCVLVDVGHSLTSVSVYFDGALQHLAVIPLGGNSLTKDLASARNIPLEEAERVKLALKELDIVSRCRYEEIAANVLAQIAASGYKDRLEAGCVLTGGASLQTGLVSLFSERLGISKIEVRGFSGITVDDAKPSPLFAALTTMVTFCTANCEIEETEPDLFGDGDFGDENSETETTGETTEETASADSEDQKEDGEKEPEEGKDEGDSKNPGDDRDNSRRRFGTFFKDLFKSIDD